MSARGAFVLGAIVGAGVLAAVGAVSAGSSHSSAPKSVALVVGPQGRADTAPAGLLADLKQLDELLAKARTEPLDRERIRTYAREVQELKAKIGDRYFQQVVNGAPASSAIGLFDKITVSAWNEAGNYADYYAQELATIFFTQPIYGVKLNEIISTFDAIDKGLIRAGRFLHFAELDEIDAKHAKAESQKENFLAKAKEDRAEAASLLLDAGHFKMELEKEFTKVSPPQNVTISEDDTWAHNTDIGKSRVCVNVRTTPPQASVSATITGPGGYNAQASKSPLHADGTGQIRGLITQPGDYTKTIIVYDANGNQTATVTKTFTVAPPPQDGPATTPPCAKPTQ